MHLATGQSLTLEIELHRNTNKTQINREVMYYKQQIEIRFNTCLQNLILYSTSLIGATAKNLL